MDIKHSILVITYNQEDYIREALNSLVFQTELPFEIIIVDDKSSDSTFNLILEYQKAYPKLIKAYQNEINIGVYKNYEKVKSLSNGNVISFCSGDDKLDLCCVENVNKEYKRLNINPKRTRAIVITNSMHLYTDGDLILWNNYKERNIKLLKSYLRTSLSHRGVGYSKALLSSIPKITELEKKFPSLGWGYDILKGLYEAELIETYSHINVVGGIYRLNIGVTSANKTSEFWFELSKTFNLIQNTFKDLDEKDISYINFVKIGCQNKISNGLIDFIKVLTHLIENFNNFGYNNPFLRNTHYLFSDKKTQTLKTYYKKHLKILLK
jgi:glycosyltransferase involved in cell wall biosynthesis